MIHVAREINDLYIACQFCVLLHFVLVLCTSALCVSFVSYYILCQFCVLLHCVLVLCPPNCVLVLYPSKLCVSFASFYNLCQFCVLVHFVLVLCSSVKETAIHLRKIKIFETEVLRVFCFGPPFLLKSVHHLAFLTKCRKDFFFRYTIVLYTIILIPKKQFLEVNKIHLPRENCAFQTVLNAGVHYLYAMLHQVSFIFNGLLIGAKLIFIF